MAISKEQKKRKAFAEKILRVKGVDYDEWLDTQHKKIIEGSEDILLDALELWLETPSRNPSSQSTGSNTFQSSNSIEDSK